MEKSRIIEELARQGLVEEMVKNISGRSSLSADLQDIVQEVYLILLEYDDEKIADLWENGEMRFFLARIISNQLNSVTSPFYTKYRKFRRMVDESLGIMDRNGCDRVELDILESWKVIVYED